MERMVHTTGDQNVPQIVFFDLETTVPRRTGQKFCVLEFGAIVVCPQKLVELESYCTLIRPRDLSVVSITPGRSEGITRQAVSTAPMFEEVADRIFSILDGRVWAGHNIQRFDCPRIREAFAAIGRPAPEPIGMIDSLRVLTQKFGRRAGDMKMATLASYFGLGQQPHRSLADARMNLEVVKHCATVLFLESCLPALANTSYHGSSPVTTRSRSNIGNALTEEESSSYNQESSLPALANTSYHGSSTVTTRSRSNIGKALMEEESSSYNQESSLPALANTSYHGSSTVTTRSRSNMGKALMEEESSSYNQESSLPALANTSYHGSSTVTTRSRSKKALMEEESSSRKYPPPTVAYNTRSRCMKQMTESMKGVLCKAKGSQPLNNLLKHSHLLLK